MTRAQILKIIAEIRKRYGAVIDLEKSPLVLVEVLRNYGRLFADDGTGGVSPGTISTVAVGINDGTGPGGTGTGGTGTGGTGTGGTGTGGTGTGGTSPGTSTVAVGIIPPASNFGVEIEEILRVTLNLQKSVKQISQKLDRLAPK